MKQILLSLFAFFGTCLYAQNPFPNASFETWNNNIPIGWTNTYNVYEVPGHNGGKAVSVPWANNSPRLGIGTANNLYPCTQTYQYFSFWYKSDCSGDNFFWVLCSIQNASGWTIVSTIDGSDTYGRYGIHDAATEFTQVILPMEINSGTPAEMTATFSHSLNYCNEFVIDDVSLTDTPLSVDLEDANSGFRFALYCFPNPTLDNIHAQFYNATAEEVQVALMDMNGRQVLAPVAASGIEAVVDLDVSQLPTGLYFMQAQTSHGTVSRKVSVVH